MNYYVSNSELYHFGIKGQKWGVRRWQNKDGSYNAAGKERYFDEKSGRARYIESDSGVTKRAKADYNTLGDKEFRKKYGATKDEYRKRVEKYGDPYRNTPIRKMMQKKAEKKADKINKKLQNIDKDIKSFESIKDGLKDKKGRDILTKQDVEEWVSTLKTEKAKQIEIGQRELNKLTMDKLVYDKESGQYVLRERKSKLGANDPVW